MRLVALVTAALLLAGCTADPVPSSDRPCPGHFHFTLLVADGDAEVPYFSEGDLDASAPVPGIHMHAEDGLVHVHPFTPTCYTLRDGLNAIGVTVRGDGIDVDGGAYNGPITLEIQPWGDAWQTVSLAELDLPILDAERVLLMVNAPADHAALRGQVPGIPAQYQPVA